mmetsp:Transcript_35117/g.109231  ORF Transcript_35117/g.109231 Transcript_35117/m.109231 type:complete len:226 (+) Transcript_35117:386-1063(+)
MAQEQRSRQPGFPPRMWPERKRPRQEPSLRPFGLSGLAWIWSTPFRAGLLLSTALILMGGGAGLPPPAACACLTPLATTSAMVSTFRAAMLPALLELLTAPPLLPRPIAPPVNRAMLVPRASPTPMAPPRVGPLPRAMRAPRALPASLAPLATTVSTAPRASATPRASPAQRATTAAPSLGFKELPISSLAAGQARSQISKACARAARGRGIRGRLSATARRLCT